MKSINRLLPIVAIVAAGVAIAVAVSSGGGTTTRTVTTVVPASRSAQPTSLNKSGGLTINDLYKMDDPGVVDIVTSETQSSGGLFNFGQQQTEGEGAGVVYNDKGDIITDEHVVSGASSVKVNFPNGQSASAKVV